MTRFDYIITIHNREDMIEKVIFSLLACMKNDSHIYAVLDGCTDKTEQILDQIAHDYANLPITKVYEQDVHEIRSINAALRLIPTDGDGFIISLQDDVLIADRHFEDKVEALYKTYGQKLGYVSFRLAANLIPNEGELAMKEVDLVESAYSSHGLEADKANEGEIAFRDASIKSPVCIPRYLLRSIGILDEDLAPYSWDDHEYSIRSLKAGYRNALYPIKFISDIDWGGTRRAAHTRMSQYHIRNTRTIRQKHQDFFDSKRERNQKIEQVPKAKLRGPDYEAVVGKPPSGKISSIGRRLSGKALKK